MTKRSAIWLISMFSLVPYLLLFGWAILSDPAMWWLPVLLFIASWPVIVLPMVAVIHAADIPKQT